MSRASICCSCTYYLVVTKGATRSGYRQRLSGIGTNPRTNIDFSSVTFYGIAFNTVSTSEQEFRNLLNRTVVTGGNNVLSVAGTTGGNAAFSGNISFASMAAVPEPTTWMLMLMGMAGIGFPMRRKEKQALRVRYT